METRTNKALLKTLEGRASGYALVYDSVTTIKEGRREFQEVIKRGAAKWGEDVKLFLNHDTNGIPLASTKAGTLTLRNDETGLWFDAELPESAQREREAIARQDIDGCSFQFSINREGERSKGIRELQDITIHEISIVNYPAYEDTSVSLRSANLLRWLDAYEKSF